METEMQQAREALRTIAEAESAARRHGPNNGTVPLVWGVVVLVGMIGFDLMPGQIAALTLGLIAAAASLWTSVYNWRLPVQPRKIENKWLFAWWALFHAAVLMGGLALGSHFWRAERMQPGAWTVMGLVDSAPLFYIGWRMRRRARGDGEGTRP